MQFTTDAAAEPVVDPTVEPDLHVTITAPTDEADVGDELMFEVDVENLGTGAATNVIVRVTLPENTEFVEARWRPSDTAQTATLDAYVDGDDVVIDLGDVAPSEAVNVELVVRALAKGSVALAVSTEADNVAATAPINSDQSVEVDDVYLEVVNTIVPLNTCGWLGVTPALMLLGLLGAQRRSIRRR